MTEPVGVFVSAGSNIEPDANLQLAYTELVARYGEVRCSAVYRNPAVGFAGDDFLNVVFAFSTSDSAATVLAALEDIHAAAKRVRLAEKYSPRTLDLDMLLYGDLINAELKVPHGDIEKYPFVLQPLAELAPEQVHPVSGLTLADMQAAAPATDLPMEVVALEFGS